jgi:hypothetical protein
MHRGAILSLLLFSALAAAQSPPGSERLTAEREARFRGHVAYLSDDRLKGRQAGTAEHDVAARYIASEFRQLRLEPAGDAGSWFQTVPMLTASTSAGSLTISGPSGAESWQHGEEVALAPSPSRRSQDVTAPVVFVGYGVQAPRYGIDDYQGLDVRGKIVVFVGDRLPNVPGDVSAVLMFRREQIAASRGAIGALRIVGETPLKAERRDPKTYWLNKNGSPFRPLPPHWVGGLVTTKVAKALLAGSDSDLEAIFSQVKAKNGRPAAAALETKVRLQTSSAWKLIKAPQVLGMLKGSDPKLRDEVVILTAHLDGRGIDPAAPSGSDNVRNATIDNAAGIATLLEVARSFSGAAPPKRSILFFANTAEEKWLIGSSYFANNPTFPARRMSSVTNIDTPLITVDVKDVIAFGAEHSTLGPTAERVIRESGLSATVDPMPDEGLFVRTDHYSFVEKGIPSIHLQVGFANGGEEQWKRYFGSHYHGVSDDMNQQIFWSAGARFADLHYRLIRALAEGDARPQWRRGSFLGDLFAGNQRKADELK